MRAAHVTLVLTTLSVGCGGDEARSDAGTVVTADVAAADVTPDAPWTCPRARRGTPGMSSACNGSEALCGRRFDEVAYATTHNAMSSEERGFASPNQRRSITRQLRDGVRGLMLDIHPWQDEVSLCHGTCFAGAQRHVEGLCEIARFLDENPGEVVTIIYESYVSGDRVAANMREVGLLDDLHTQRAGTPWPTLAEMVRANRRLVAFTDRDGGSAGWYHDVWAWAQENPYAARTPGELSCRMNRGRAANGLFIYNRFLTAPLASPELAAMVNFNPALLDHARQCQRDRMRLPNFVTVDFYDIGDVLPTVAALNGLTPVR